MQEPAAPDQRTTTQSAMALLEPGRSSRSGLLACCAGVHVDFHANRHFNDLRCFPGHRELQVRGTITALKYGKATPKVAQACAFFSRSSSPPGRIGDSAIRRSSATQRRVTPE